MKSTHQINKINVALALVILVMSACKKDDDKAPEPSPAENEEEVITTLKLSFTDPTGTQPAVEAAFRDPDGEGGSGPDLFDTIRLVANTTYNVSLVLLNETTTPATDISAEVKEEGDEHLICFTPSGVDLVIQRIDSDGTHEIGLESKWITGAATSGSIRVELKHQPGVKNGSCDPGDTDVDVSFRTEIE